ncbi:hypothetical protein [Brucella cytisi]|uniref:Uncharacterized protein n=1 Tax=Brucella cytisi TaxID=407152 RepID=A0A1J6I736_9HYPH|nr:hypothetical protein [Brucella cytisi]OIS93646.1 hypothetical protein BLA27_10040 [Brucella cytisi]
MMRRTLEGSSIRLGSQCFVVKLREIEPVPANAARNRVASSVSHAVDGFVRQSSCIVPDAA